jgi:hypothetical protein
MSKYDDELTKEKVKDFLKVVLKLEQENLYIKKHGLKDKIKEEIKKRIR